VGFIALAGLDAETGVVMLVYLKHAWQKRKEAGAMNTPEDLREAIMEGAVLRVRPKLMTVATTFIGLLPIMFSHGAGAEVMKRIAAPMVGGLVTAVTELADGRLVMMMDVEKVLSETTHYDDDFLFKDIKPLELPDATVFFADDSTVARNQIQRTLEVLGVKFFAAINGRHAWEELERAATYAQSTGRKTRDLVSLVLTDVEMPEMDGYILTKKIKSDPRFDGIPVIMHSSLSGMSNQQLGRSVGVDEYVPKFEPQRLAEVLGRLLHRDTQIVPV